MLLIQHLLEQCFQAAAVLPHRKLLLNNYLGDHQIVRAKLLLKGFLFGFRAQKVLYN